MKIDLNLCWAHMSVGTFSIVAAHLIPSESVTMYSRTAIPRTPDGSFTMADSKLFLSPYEMFPIAPEKKYFRLFFLILSWNCMLCVLIRIASSRRF